MKGYVVNIYFQIKFLAFHLSTGGTELQFLCSFYTDSSSANSCSSGSFSTKFYLSTMYPLLMGSCVCFLGFMDDLPYPFRYLYLPIFFYFLGEKAINNVVVFVF